MSYNFLRDARSIKNSFLCRYDSLDAYMSDFHENGNVDGWDIYNNVYLYGCWNNIVFGTSYERSCYISRTNVFVSVEAENYYYIKIMMKITNNNSDKYEGHPTADGIIPTPPGGLTTGRIQWVTITDTGWDISKQIDFDIIADDKWHLYTINVGPEKDWQGNVNNLRIYPFIDGWKGDEFSIKYIKISSLDSWKCSNTQCSYYLQYDHPCPGAGRRPSCEAGTSKSLYTTVSGVSDELIVNIDNYGEEKLDLGSNDNLNGIEISRIINNKLSSLNVGGYTFAEVEYLETDKIKITSGNVGSNGSIKIGYSLAAEALGFYEDGEDISIYEAGVDSATGFDYASSRMLRAFEINRLLDGDIGSFAYIHNPEQYNVEGGRRDFNEIGTYHLSSDVLGTEYYESLNNKGRTLIDISHPINANGRIKAIYLYGKIDSLSKVKICRPHRDGTLTVIYSLDLPLEDSDKMYTARPTNYRLDCNILVSKGDLIGVYNANLYVGVSITGNPDATFYQINGEISGTFDPGKAYAFGVAGFAIYARSDRYQNNAILDIDLGNRVNIEEVSLYGKKEAGYFEFNIASCLDVNWEIDLFSQSHYHVGTQMITMLGFTDTHQNEAFGTSCLDDGVVTADNGDAGNTIDGHTGNFSYFFINGDAEWLYAFECDGKHEYCYPKVPNGVYGFTYDPIAFTLKFPYGYRAKIHKSIMYFKERNNFRSIALSYYLGPYDSTGNADSPYYRLIPLYNSIRLDGLLYEEDDGSAINTYIFKNPTYAKIDYASGDKDPINWEEYAATFYADWTIIEHNFDPIECYGFRIYTNHHNSTKITELEVYNKIETESSLLDSISLSFSDYGDIWKSTFFDETTSEKVTAFVGGAPRYLLLELESSTEFSINEIEFLVGDQIKVEDCEDNVLLEESKTNSINQATPIILENIYDKSFDLLVDLPKETYENDDIIFWSKLGSQEELDNPEIGPGCILHKSGNYEIKNDNGQCAIEIPAYGLKNLIHNKEAYYNLNDADWFSYGTLSSGISIDFCNLEYNRYKESILVFEESSSKYWKISSIDVSDLAVIKDIIAYYNDSRVEIKKLYADSDVGSSSQIYEFDSNGVNIEGYELIIDNFEDGAIDPRWIVGGTGILTESDGKITVSSWEASGGPTMTYDFGFDVSNFVVNAAFLMKMASSAKKGEYIIQLLNSSDIEILKLYLVDAWTASTNIEEYVIDKGITLWHAGSFLSTIVTNDVEFIRVGNTIKYKANGVTRYTGVISTDPIRKIVLKHLRYADALPPEEFSTYDFSLAIRPLFFDNTAFGFSFDNSKPINKIKLIHQNCDLTKLTISSSPDNGNNYVQVAGFKYTDDITEPGGVCSARTVYADDPSYNCYKAFDNNDGNFYHSKAGYPHWIGYDFGIGNKKAVVKIRIKFYHGYYSETVIVQGSDSLDINWEDKTWADIYTMTGIDSTGDQWNEREFNNLITYRFYRLYGAIAGPGGGAYWAVMEIEMMEAVPYTPEITIDPNNENYYNYLAIDLERRHDIDIIRNYGNTVDKIFLSTADYVDYSNTNILNIDDVVWNNSDENDARWMRIKLLCGDGTNRCVRKLGIYSDISNAYCIDGGYNCEWESLGNILSDYTPSINIAYGATVTGTNYYFMDYYPTNAVDGIFDDYRAQACWGFQKVNNVDPYLEIDFGDTYLIYKIKLYHGDDLISSNFMNKDYAFDISTSVSGSFTNILNVTDNDEHEVTYQFDPVSARRARLTIIEYDYKKTLVYNYETGIYEEFSGSFLREIEIYTYADRGYVDSETWPIICMNLKDKFNIIDHDLINKNILDTNTNWDNSEEFFRYSDNIWDDPKKVSFVREGDYVIIYEEINSSGDIKGSTEYLFEENVYLEEGRYNIEWDSYYAEYENEISLRFDGNEVIDSFAETLGAGWIKQIDIIDINLAGFYDIKAIQHISADNDWGARNPIIYRSYGYTKWIGVMRDTAENYSYDDDSGKYGKDYLSLIKVYGNDKYNPLEYSWWWFSLISELDNDAINVKVGAQSLKIFYPVSSDIDEVSFIEGDDLGKDIYWSIKDSLSFWWLIEDVDKLDITFGDITFGIINNGDPIYYKWNISSLDLNSGWNNIKLGFENYDSIYPVAESFGTYPFLDKKSDFRTNDRYFESIRLRYRGKGFPFIMNIDDLKIERNAFEDNAKFGKGLCLTGQDYLEIPISGIDLRNGAIEFYLKTYYDSNGKDIFNEMNSKTLFTIVNNNNDLISLGIRSNGWFEIFSGHVRKNLNLFSIDENDLPLDAFININQIVSLAIVWSNDGKFLDNGDTLRFYINGKLICGNKDTWEVSDTKSAIIRLGGFNTQLAGNQDFWGGGIFDNVKIYNYCKTDFDVNKEDIDKDIVYTPNDFLEISKDNINFYNMRSSSLPLIFEQVPSGESRTIYVRSNKNDNFKQSKKTASLIVEWLTTV